MSGSHDMLVVALDGPAGAGKSSVSKLLARRLQVPYLDTGAMYRCVALAALRRGVDLADETALGRLATEIDIVIGSERVTIDGVDSTAAIRSADVNAVVSVVAAVPGVRAEMRAQQRRWAERAGGGVVEGRDIGSVVFPDATLKVFLTASPTERARRRAAEVGGDVAEIAASIAERDRIDTTRADSPLVATDDSVTLTTDGLTIGDVVERIAALAEARTESRSGASPEAHPEARTEASPEARTKPGDEASIEASAGARSEQENPLQ